ncbi:MAG: hypothetical protein FMNOHCHN_03751 [Ignavibacteriaceae bacterium]|nr:hypothetical protein [Ignavibacteriaceae bacterium]
MPILTTILKFILIQLIQAIVTAQMVKDATLAVLKRISKWTKNTWDDKIYRRVRFYMLKDKSDRINLDK